MTAAGTQLLYLMVLLLLEAFHLALLHVKRCGIPAGVKLSAHALQHWNQGQHDWAQLHLRFAQRWQYQCCLEQLQSIEDSAVVR